VISVFFDKSNPHGICLSAIRGRNILVPHGQSAVRKVLTAYGDGLWGLRERVGGWRITRRGNYCKFCNNCHRWEKLWQ
ncbi:hypothetical protein, partial [Hallella sp.]|uniref:hypothetical protein n=1 Tax=Hallella sp. TaxID=2980186 RepID=UPI0030807D66